MALDTKIKNARRMAASLLKCGEHRVWLSPTMLEDVGRAVTRSSVRSLIVSGAIQKKKIIGISRVRARYAAQQRGKGRRRGHGSRKGAQHARKGKKEKWIQTIRPIREWLRYLRDSGKIEVSVYRKFYRLSKGGMFKSKAHLNSQLKIGGYLKEM